MIFFINESTTVYIEGEDITSKELSNLKKKLSEKGVTLTSKNDNGYIYATVVSNKHKEVKKLYSFVKTTIDNMAIDANVSITNFQEGGKKT